MYSLWLYPISIWCISVADLSLDSQQLHSNRPQCQKDKLSFRIIVISKSARCHSPTRTDHPSVKELMSKSFDHCATIPFPGPSCCHPLSQTDYELFQMDFTPFPLNLSVFYPDLTARLMLCVNDRQGLFK